MSAIYYTAVAKVRFRLKGVQYGKDLSVTGPLLLRIHPSSKIVLGDCVKIHSGFNLNPVGAFRRTIIHVSENAKLQIANNVGISNCTIVAQKSVAIGANSKIGGSVEIYDTDFHSLIPGERLLPDDPGIAKANVSIGNECFIGGGSLILKGVKIGERAVLGANSVVAKDIPKEEIWAGNPARKIRNLFGEQNP